MVFTSFTFILLFLPATFLLYFLFSSIKWKNGVLIVTSLLFYAWGEFQYTFVMVGSITLAWAAGCLIDRARSNYWKRIFLISGISGVMAILLYFKYAGFLINNANFAIQLFRPASSMENVPIHLPIGISFYTFQSVSYLVDLYRGKIGVQRSLTKLALIKTFFPQLIAGPIVRYADVCQYIDKRVHSVENFAFGARRFIYGFAQKILIADIVGKVADGIFDLTKTNSPDLRGPVAWLGGLCYFFQIYYDFCGYSNMAIGMGRMCGFHFLENFDHPYSARSMTDFWRRWHISLSSWFRDYLYIPLGGNRVSPARTYVNLFIVFALCGLWHGASWTYVIWGLFHGSMLVIERQRWLSGLIARLPRVASLAYVWLTVLVSWVIFRNESIPIALTYLRRMFEPMPGSIYARPLGSFLDPEICIALAAAALFSFDIMPEAAVRRMPLAGSYAFSLALVGIFVMSIIYLSGSTFSPFIYYRF
jgi:alginate O-acetyltransferase complex protein AlgI